MKIEIVELWRVAVPLRGTRPVFHWPASHGGKSADRFYPSWIPGLPQTEMRLYLLRLIADNGIEGIAAIPMMGTERDSLGPMLGTYLIGLDPCDRDAVNARIEEFSYLGLRNGWIESAFLDIAAKQRGVPLWSYLGGTGGSVRPYWSTGDTYGHAPEAARGVVEAALRRGFSALKLRVKSSELGVMVRFLEAARAASGDRLELMVDCNQGWPVSIVEPTPRWSRAFAIELAREVERLGFYWIEEPLHRGDVEGLAELRRSLSSLRVAGGEINACLNDYQRLLDAGALDVYQPDAVLAEGTFSGGVTLVERLLPLLRRRPPDRRPLAYCPHTWTTGIGFVVNLHLMGLLGPEDRHFIEFPIEGPWTPESWGALFDQPIAPDASGRIALPTAPGLGVHLDWGKVKRHGTRLHRATPMRVALSAVKDRGLAVALEVRRRRSRSDAAPPREAT